MAESSGEQMAVSSGDTPTEPANRGVGSASVTSWERFELRLGAYLSTMVDPTEGDHLLLEAPGESGADGCAPYLQFAAFGEGRMVRAEVSSNLYLAPAHHLTAQQTTDFRPMGWLGGDEHNHNHYLERPVADAKLIASIAVVVLRDYFHLPYPELLSVQAWGPAAAGIAILGLPDTADVPADIVDSAATPSAPALLVAYPEDRAQLMDCVRGVLRDRYAGKPKTDDDEDFVLSHLGQPVWVRVCQGQPAVQIMARIVHSVHSRRQTAVELGLLNRDHPWLKWILHERSVWQTLLVPAQPFAPEHLSDALDLFFAAMSETRDDLVLRTGGRTA